MTNTDIQLQQYEETSGLQREILDCLIVQFAGIIRYDITRFLVRNGVSQNSVSTLQNAINSLVQRDLVNFALDQYYVDPELSIRLLPDLLLQPKYQSMVRNMQMAEQNSFNPPVTQLIRNYLFAGLVEVNKYTLVATDRLMSRIPEAVPLFAGILAMPVYDKALWCSPVLLYRILDVVHLYNILNFQDTGFFIDFLNRQSQSKDFLRRMNTPLMEISFQTGKIGFANRSR